MMSMKERLDKVLTYLIENSPAPIAFVTWFNLMLLYVFVLSPIESYVREQERRRAMRRV